MFGLGSEQIAISIGIFFLFILGTIGDKIFLVFVSAKEIGPKYEHINARLQNLACRMEVKNIRLYKTFYLPANVYILQSFIGSSTLIFSMDVFDKADEKMIEDILEKAVLQIKSKRSRFSLLICLLQFCLIAPKYFLERIGLKAVAILYAFLLLPLEYIKNLVAGLSTKNSSDMIESNNDIQVVYYLDKFKSEHRNYLVDLSKDFALYKRFENSLWSALLNSYTRPMNRYNHERLNERESQ